jgi:hypothetical protein
MTLHDREARLAHEGLLSIRRSLELPFSAFLPGHRDFDRVRQFRRLTSRISTSFAIWA